MRRVVMSMLVFLDGFTEGPGAPDDWSWHVFDAGMEKIRNERPPLSTDDRSYAGE
jgi:hypothetical protein